MAETTSEVHEVSSGMFAYEALPTFDRRQAWERTSYWNVDYFSVDGGMGHALWRVGEGTQRDVNLLFSDVVLGMGSTLGAVPYKMSMEKIEDLRKTFAGDDEALASLAGLHNKVEAREAARLEAQSRKLGDIALSMRGRLHVLVRRTTPASDGRIEGLFGKLWGITNIDGKNRPVVAGKDGVPARVNPPGYLWLYIGALESE
jgi:hypothetical protein